MRVSRIHDKTRQAESPLTTSRFKIYKSSPEWCPQQNFMGRIVKKVALLYDVFATFIV